MKEEPKEMKGNTIQIPESSDWKCYMFGAKQGDGFCWTPQKGNVPNRFIRFMSIVFFGCTWVKEV